MIPRFDKALQFILQWRILLDIFRMTLRYLHKFLNLRIMVTSLFVVVTIFVSVVSALRDTQSSFILIEGLLGDFQY